MFIPFEQMPDGARIWVYQLNRAVSEQEREIIEAEVQKFCESWAAHGNPLQTSFELRYNHFLILAVDEQHNDASGCSIDSSVHVLKALEEKLQISFFERLQVAFLVEDKVQLMGIDRMKEKLRGGEMKGGTLTFNHLVATKEELGRRWIVPISASWLARHLPKSALA
jgi:hypothetical protein